MLINMVLKNRLGENPSRSEKDKFVKKFQEHAENVPTGNQLCSGGAAAFQCTRDTLRDCAQSSGKPQNPATVPLLTRVLSGPGTAKPLFCPQNMAFWQPCLNRLASQELSLPKTQLCLLHGKWNDVKRLFLKRLMKASWALNSFYEHFHFNVNEK